MHGRTLHPRLLEHAAERDARGAAPGAARGNAEPPRRVSPAGRFAFTRGVGTVR
ncbi:hypothetical protein [Agromyces luteolus]|uniref:Uncharacterized protein n=1 Tax=Agromyces luteolus TaxID=88373 RepID=A0A7C9LGY2_9MICO|nr:hypothetical protein [Agromyces luteolus]MUN07335.1 hypothetical protein [Agromyces luteolus]